MKWCTKCFVVFAVCSLLWVIDVGQAEGQHVGLFGGLNFASADQIQLEDVATTLDNRTGFHIGGYIDIGSDRVWIRPGLQYISAGSLYEGIGEEIPTTIRDDFGVRVVSVPVDVRLEFGPSAARPYLFVGPVFHFRWFADAPEPFEDNIQPRDFAGTAGAGVRIGGDNADIRFVPQFRYTFGLANVVNESFTVGDVTVNPADNMSFIFISLALEF